MNEDRYLRVLNLYCFTDVRNTRACAVLLRNARMRALWFSHGGERHKIIVAAKN